MEEDVKLSMNQAHEKWTTKYIVGFVFVAFCATLGTCAYTTKVQSTADVQGKQLDAEKAKQDAMKAMWDHQK